MSVLGGLGVMSVGRSPHGERGLKYRLRWSLLYLLCRSPHGERGLKCQHIDVFRHRLRRSPHGERGLKYQVHIIPVREDRSLSSWRAWIEITSSWRSIPDCRVALLMESVD